MPDMSEEEPPAATALCSIKAAPKARPASLKVAASSYSSKAPASSMKSSKSGSRPKRQAAAKPAVVDVSSDDDFEDDDEDEEEESEWEGWREFDKPLPLPPPPSPPKPRKKKAPPPSSPSPSPLPSPASVPKGYKKGDFMSDSPPGDRTLYDILRDKDRPWGWAKWGRQEREALLVQALSTPEAQARLGVVVDGGGGGGGREQQEGAPAAPPPQRPTISFDAFRLALFLAAEEFEGIEAVEEERAIRGCKTVADVWTMYGAVRESLVESLASNARIGLEDRFVDIGAGLGLVALQLAMTTGCHATAIELIDERLAAGGALVSSLAEALRLTGKVPEATLTAMLARYVPVRDDIRNRMAELRDATVLFLNNGGGWIDKQRGFTGMGMGGGAPNLHQRIAALFAQGRVGARLMTVEKVVDIHAGRTRGGPEEGGWVDLQELTHPSSQFSWLMPGADDKSVYIYTKLRDSWRCGKCRNARPNAILQEDGITFTSKCAHCGAAIGHSSRDAAAAGAAALRKGKKRRRGRGGGGGGGGSKGGGGGSVLKR